MRGALFKGVYDHRAGDGKIAEVDFAGIMICRDPKPFSVIPKRFNGVF